MTTTTLPNYLLSHRKCASLSQKEAAFLVGLANAEQVSRYERFACEPSLKMALAYEAVFQKPVRELFSGLYEEIEREVAARATSLATQPGTSKNKEQTLRRGKAIAGLVAKASTSQS